MSSKCLLKNCELKKFREILFSLASTYYAENKILVYKTLTYTVSYKMIEVGCLKSRWIGVDSLQAFRTDTSDHHQEDIFVYVLYTFRVPSQTFDIEGGHKTLDHIITTSFLSTNSSPLIEILVFLKP